jgi:hypothetical protein
MKRHSIAGLVCQALLVAALAAGPGAPAFADAVPGMYWTSVGSAGTVDEADVAVVLLDGAAASHAAAFGRIVRIRYNVVAVDGLSGAVMIVLAANFTDTGSPSQVLLTLKRHSFETGATESLLTLNSDTFAGSWSPLC